MPVLDQAAAESAAAPVVRGQRDLPLSRPGLRGAAFPCCRRVRGRMDAHRVCGADLRAFHAPVRTIRAADRRTRLLLVALGVTLAAMNLSFYLALDRLPMSLVAAMEFLSTILIALLRLAQRPQSSGARACGRRRVRPHRLQLVD